MKEQLEQIRKEALAEIAADTDLRVLDDIRVRYLGKKGGLTAILKQMGGLSAEERPVMGALANEVRAAIEQALESKVTELRAAKLEEKLHAERLDVTLPGKPFEMGKKHPLTTVLDELKDIFIGMGFQIAEGPEVEYDHYNFEKLNIPRIILPETRRTPSISMTTFFCAHRPPRCRCA